MQPPRTKLHILPFLVRCLMLGVWTTATAADGLAATPHQVRIAFVGDIMLDRDPGKGMLAGRDPFASVADLLEESDLTVGNLECVVADSGTRIEKHFTFRADPQAVPYLARYFDAVSLANNHTGDFGHAALIETMYRLRRANLPFFGAGLNDEEAHMPWIVEKNGVRIAVLGYNEFRPRSFEAGPKAPGCAWSDDEKVVADIRAIRPQVDVALTFMHWGEEYSLQPNERQKSLAHKMVDAGADVVIGNHPHVIQGHEFYKGRLITYCLGNFVFDEWKDKPEIMKEERRIGWVLRLTLGKSGLVEWDTVTTRTDDDGFPRQVPGATGPGGKVGSLRATDAKPR
ncbi:MAG: CapA family protein [Planctomycetaceae bacterium]|nr:CapA family protein [Planctomycetaceae bacterium]